MIYVVAPVVAIVLDRLGWLADLLKVPSTHYLYLFDGLPSKTKQRIAISLSVLIAVVFNMTNLCSWHDMCVDSDVLVQDVITVLSETFKDSVEVLAVMFIAYKTTKHIGR